MQGQTWGWTSPAIVGLLAAAAVYAGVPVVGEPRGGAAGRPEAVQAEELRTDGGVLAAVQFALTGASVFGAIWSQHVLGFSPIHAGLAMLPLTIPLLFVAPLAGRAYDRFGPRRC